MLNKVTTRQARCWAFGLILMLALGSAGRAQMVTGTDMVGYSQTLGLSPDKSASANYSVHLVSSSVPGNILWPGDRPTFTFQITGTGSQPVQASGHVEVIAYGTRGAPGDVWTPHMFRMGIAASVPVAAHIAPNGFQDVTITPTVPARFGGYALVLDLGPLGRQFITSFVRTLPVTQKRVEYPHFCLDSLPLPVLQRLGVHAIRWGVPYKPTTDPDFAQWYADRGRELKAYQAAGVTVLFMAGGGAFNGPTQPLSRPRPWLDDSGKMLDTKFDLAWLPSYDTDFQDFCYRFARDYGWPKGPLTGFSLWNEPWEGISISGWGADMLRYRAMYTNMWQGVDKARHLDGAQVLVGGGDSSSNAMDKLFPDGTNTFGPMFDFLSIHYQGLSSTANYKAWVNRKGYGGRVKIWDTESWVGNTDDRVAAIVAGDRAGGYDRAMGVFGGNICDSRDYDQHLAGGTTRKVTTVVAWSTAASVGAATHFIGERPFQKLLFSNGLPWVMTFGGRPGLPEDGTVVVVGDLGEEFGADNLPFRTARGYAEARHKAALKAQLAGATGDEKVKLQTQIDALETLSGASMTLPASSDYGLYDFYGNLIPTRGNKIVVPLDGRGFFLRGSGRPGSFARLLSALRTSHVDGIQPLSVVAHDLTAPVETKPALHLTLTNVLNRSVTGRLAVTLSGLTVKTPVQTITLGANETREILLPITGQAAPSNTYALAVIFTGNGLAPAVYREDIHADVIAHRTITVDGNLDDWKGVLPQTIAALGSGAPTLTEKAWLPFKQYDSRIKSGLATAYLAYDDKNFYLAAKVADSTPDPGTVRFATRDDDQYFYPAVAYVPDSGSGLAYSVRWTGQVTPKYTERYSLTTTSDDGIRVFVDGKLLINNWTDHGPTDDTAAVDLQVGHPCEVKVEYYNSAGGGTAKLYWQSLSQPRALVPADGSGFTGQYYAGAPLSDLKTTRTDAAINFEWADGVVPDPAYRSKNGLQSVTWPADVRRYSYRKNPDLPAGNFPSHDNIQIAFNVLPTAAKRYYPTVPGTMPGFVSYQDTDYEFALNQVAPQFGGGTEVWRLAAPGIPPKHFYPRQPRSPLEGPVSDAQLVIRRDGDTLIYECAIPWTSMPEAKRLLDAGKTIKFSYRANDNAGGPTMELSKNRSVAKRNGSFHVDWVEHWANELEFGSEKQNAKQAQK
ncbi:MAG: PA14 domain-containing protein [Janthinobacterium lividum]